MEAVWLPGTLCDKRVFGELPNTLGQPSHHIATSEFSRVGDAAAAVLDTGPRKFIAIGFSLGGFVALEILRRAPERVAGLILISGNAHPDAPANTAARREEIQFASENGMPALIERFWPRIVGAPSQQNESLRKLLVAMAESIGHDGFARQVEMNIARPDLRALAIGSKVPLLVTAGSEDRQSPRERYEAAAAGVAARLEVIPGAGHFLPLEAPQALARVITPFIRRLAQ